MVTEDVQNVAPLHVPSDEVEEPQVAIIVESSSCVGSSFSPVCSGVGDRPHTAKDSRPNLGVGDRPHTAEVDTKLDISINSSNSLDPNRPQSKQSAKKKGVAFKVTESLEKPMRPSKEAWQSGGSGSAGFASARPSYFRRSAYPGRPTTPDDGDRRKDRLTSIRQTVQHSVYYRGQGAQKIRQVIHGQVFVTIMACALFVALFLPEIWVICGVNSNTPTDVVLTLVMVLFVAELILLSALDVTYLLSFFFFMDILGTVSMIFDISYMLGIDNCKPLIEQSGDEDAKNSLMLLRAARAARVGARAGRLSRVIRILRFLPFLTEKFGDETKGYAGQISKQLANLLATRVACLTIILVIAVPVIDILSFPQADHAMQTWVERLSENLLENTTIGNTAYQKDIAAMVPFFDKKDYGPYMACPGVSNGDDFAITQSLCYSANWAFSAPNRAASALWVHTDTFMVGFNMHTPIQIDRTIAIVNILFIISIMIFSGLALSNVVTTLAVKPLERMVLTVRRIAETVFNFSKEITSEEEGEDEGEEYDMDYSTADMDLLEKVVQRLAIVAQIQSGHASQHVEEGMAEEAVGVLNMMEGKDLVHEGMKQQTRRVSKNTCDLAKTRKAVGPVIDLARFGIAAEILNSYSFNTLVLNRQQMIAVGVHVVGQFHADGEGFIVAEKDVEVLKKFVEEVEKNYKSNAFHNFCHAVDVLHGVGNMLRLISSENFLTELEQYALLIAAIGHDVGHPGVNNGYLLEVADDLALQYNDLSPLENMHVSKLYSILSTDGVNVFHMLTKEQYKDVRKYCIDTILHTDMMGHMAMVNDLKMMYSKFEEIFRGGSAGFHSAGADVLSQPDNKLLVMENILHSADVSNPCRVWGVSHAWAQKVLEEFFDQGDQEKLHSIPVQPLNDRDKLNRPGSQIGFLEFMIAPFFSVQIRIFNKLYEYGDNLALNIAKWEELWAKEVDPVSGKLPDDEAQAKTKARVEKVRANLEEAKQISTPVISVVRPG